MAERREHPKLTADGAGGRVRRAGVRVAVVTATLTLALGGCTGTPEPDHTTSGGGTVIPTSPTTPSPSSPITAPPERPAAMDRTDADGAIAAATYFVSLYGYAYNTGDLNDWKAMSDPECIFCQSVVENVTEMHATGSRLDGGAVAWLEEPQHVAHDNALDEVRLVASQGSSTEINSLGDPVWNSPANEADIIVLLTRDEERWIVRGVDLEIRS